VRKKYFHVYPARSAPAAHRYVPAWAIIPSHREMHVPRRVATRSASMRGKQPNSQMLAPFSPSQQKFTQLWGAGRAWWRIILLNVRSHRISFPFDITRHLHQLSLRPTGTASAAFAVGLRKQRVLWRKRYWLLLKSFAVELLVFTPRRIAAMSFARSTRWVTPLLLFRIVGRRNRSALLAKFFPITIYRAQPW